jgi:predicted deacylase
LTILFNIYVKFWIFAKTGGILNVLHDVNTWVRRGEPIATVHSIFGHLECTYYAPDDGILHLGVVEGQFEPISNDGHL